MSDRILVLDGESGMARSLAKVLERDQIESDRVVEVRLAERSLMPCSDLTFSNRKERRSFGSSKKHLKGLRP